MLKCLSPIYKLEATGYDWSEKISFHLATVLPCGQLVYVLENCWIMVAFIYFLRHAMSSEYIPAILLSAITPLSIPHACS